MKLKNKGILNLKKQAVSLLTNEIGKLNVKTELPKGCTLSYASFESCTKSH
jgi:hypothetical protein